MMAQIPALATNSVFCSKMHSANSIDKGLTFPWIQLWHLVAQSTGGINYGADAYTAQAIRATEATTAYTKAQQYNSA
jgi:hypothetical protein